MTRKIGSTETRNSVEFLRNTLCRFTSPELMASTSGHRRNFAIAELIATLGMLDAHPRLKTRPSVSVSGAAFQQTTGTHANPFTHVVPGNLLLDGQNLTAFFTSHRAKAHVERVFGMGVMAPVDWIEAQTFPQSPGQLNKADHAVERFGLDTGLVAALEHTAAAAIAAGTWDASSKPRYTVSSLPGYVATHYGQSWKPKATIAYAQALSRMRSDLSVAERTGDTARAARAQHRMDLVDRQLAELLTKTPNFAGASANVLAALKEEEGWR